MKIIFICLAMLFLTASSFCQSGAIKVVKTGKGKPVIFLPGFTTPGTVWNQTIDNLKTERESHIISYAGFNGVSPIDTPWYPRIKQALLQYIKEENLSQLIIVAHSMGGNLAIDIAAALPQKVDKLILADAIPCMRDLMMPGVAASQIQYSSPYNKQQLQMADEAFQQMAVMMATNMTMKSDKVDSLTNWIKQADRKTYVYGYTDLLKLDQREMLKQVKAKTLILGASYPSAEVARQTFEKQYSNLGIKTIEIANDSKHFIMFDQPNWFYDKVNAFLAR